MDEEVEEILEAHGHSDLKPTQEKAFDQGILDNDDNYLLVAETGNGKTLCAEAVLKKVLNSGGKAAYLVPSRQLVRDKQAEINEWCDKDVRRGSSGYHGGDVAVATFESFYQAVLRGVGDSQNMDLVVLDDFHEIYSKHRGPGIEKTISAILNNNIRIFAMSATIGNPEEISDWLNAEPIISEEGRQIEIEEEFTEMNEDMSKAENVASIVDTKKDKAPFLVFNSSRKNAEARAKEIANSASFNGKSRSKIEDELENILEGNLTPTLKELARLMSNGVAYHHAGLPRSIKHYVEDAFMQREIDIICSTTTIAYGFDAPVQSVIVADLQRYDFQSGTMEYVGVWEYVQWIGRAARPGRGYSSGYAFILSKNPEEAKKQYGKNHRVLEDVKSHIESESMFRRFLLELISLGWQEPSEIEDFIFNTLYWEQFDSEGAWGREFGFKEGLVQKKLRSTADWLEQNKFILENRTSVAFNTTELGEAAVEFNFETFNSYSLSKIGSFFHWLDQNDNLTDKTLIKHLSNEFGISISESPSELEEGFVNTLEENNLGTDSGSQTAGIILYYWCQNLEISEIADETGIDTTNLQSIAYSMSNLLQSAKHLFKPLPDKRVPDWYNNLQKRIKHGVRKDELVFADNINGVGRYRIRQFRNYVNEMASSRGVEKGTLLETSYNFYKDIDQDPEKFRDGLENHSSSIGIGSKIAGRIADFITSKSETKQDEQDVSTVPSDEEDISTSDTTTLSDF